MRALPTVLQILMCQRDRKIQELEVQLQKAVVEQTSMTAEAKGAVIDPRIFKKSSPPSHNLDLHPSVKAFAQVKESSSPSHAPRSRTQSECTSHTQIAVLNTKGASSIQFVAKKQNKVSGLPVINFTRLNASPPDEIQEFEKKSRSPSLRSPMKVQFGITNTSASGGKVTKQVKILPVLSNICLRLIYLI